MTLVDTNILIDVLTADPDWQSWSASALRRQSQHGQNMIDEIVYAELAARYAMQNELDEVVGRLGLQFERMPQSDEARCEF